MTILNTACGLALGYLGYLVYTELVQKDVAKMTEKEKDDIVVIIK